MALAMAASVACGNARRVCQGAKRRCRSRLDQRISPPARSAASAKTATAAAESSRAAVIAAAESAAAEATTTHAYAAEHGEEGERAEGQPQQHGADEPPPHAACDQSAQPGADGAAEHAAQHRAQHDRADQHHEADFLRAGSVCARRGGLRRRQLLAVDQLHQLLHAGLQSAEIVALLELRGDDLGDDALGDGVGNGAFQPVADFDAHGAVVFGDEQQHAVVLRLTAQLPRLGHANAVLLDGFRRGAGHHEDGDLAAFARGEGSQFLIERGGLLRGEGAGEVGDRRGERGHRRQRGPDQRAKSAQQQRGQPALPESAQQRHAALLRCGRRGGAAEVHLGRHRDGFLVLHGEAGLDLHAHHHGGEVAGELAHQVVVVLHGFDVAHAGHGDAVLRAFELGLQIAEHAIGLELRIVFGHRDQARQRAGHLRLRLLELGKGGRIVDGFGRGLDLADLGARLRHLDEHVFFMRGVTLDHVHQIGHQIGPALILVEHLGPTRFDLLVGRLQGVVAAAAQAQQGGGKQEKGYPAAHERVSGKKEQTREETR